MEKLFVLLLALLLAVNCYTQRDSKWSADLSFGKTAYVGDVGNGMFNYDQAFYSFANARVAYRFQAGMWVEGGMAYGSIGFMNELEENNFLDRHFRMYSNLVYAPYYYNIISDLKFTPSMYTGVGFSYFTPVEERGVEDINLNVPFGLGLELNWNHQYAVFWRGAYQFNYGDIMDGVDDGDNDHFTTNEIGLKYYFNQNNSFDIPQFGDIVWRKRGRKSKSHNMDDLDNDGVLDRYDKCPDLAGPISNNGCPEISKETYDLFDRALRGVQFDFNKATLKTSSNMILDEIAEILLGNPYLQLSIHGHTDHVGTDNYNLKLSNARAKTVHHYLEVKGIAPDRMTFKGYGESMPISSNVSEEGRALNRRVVFQVNY